MSLYVDLDTNDALTKFHGRKKKTAVHTNLDKTAMEIMDLYPIPEHVVRIVTGSHER